MALVACGFNQRYLHMTITIPDDSTLSSLATQVGHHLLAARRRLVTAESCTGGWIGKAMTDIPGSSAWFAGGAISYSNDLKQKMLGVKAATLARHGAVSEATAREMAEGALITLGGDIAVAVSGVAGPDGGTADKPVGTVWFAWAFSTPSPVVGEGRGEGPMTTVDRRQFAGYREAVRRQAVHFALARILAL
jgi:nicotinamide-nucleotide amidase